MTHGFKIHKRLQEILAEIKRLEHTSEEVNEDYRGLLERQADKLQKQHRRYYGFNYHPLMYEDREK